MSETSRYGSGLARRMQALIGRIGIAVLVMCCWAGHAAAENPPAGSPDSIKIAVFPFELEDHSAAREQGSSPVVSSYLAQSTDEAKQQLLQSGRYDVIDTGGADMGATEGQELRNCGGCEAAIARKLGADQAMIGVVTKISMTEYVIRLRVSDVENGEVIAGFTTDLRMGTSDSWFRGVRWLMKNRMLASN